MTPINLRGEYWGMPIPEDAWHFIPENLKTDFVINMGYLIYPTAGKKKWLYLDGMPGVKLPGLDYNPVEKKAVKMPAGTWQIICLSGECTEEQAAEIVECTHPKVPGAKVQIAFYKNYEEEYSSFGGAVPSLESLLRSKGMNEKNTLILKQVR